MATKQPATQAAIDYSGIFGAAEQTETVTTGGSYLTTAEKTAIYENKTNLHIHSVGERVSFKWQRPEWVLQVTVGNDPAQRLLTFEKGSAARDQDVTNIQLFLKSPKARNAAGQAIALPVSLYRDENKRARPWRFGKPA